MHHDELLRDIADALAKGAERVSQMRTRWDISKGCQQPATVSLFARPGGDHLDAASKFIREMQKHFPGATAETRAPDRKAPGKMNILVKRGKSTPLELELATPCRKCDVCLQHRRRLWTARALAETRAAPRTWFGSLTLRPEARLTMLSRARVRYAENETVNPATGEIVRDDLDALGLGAEFLALHREISSEITRYLKRVRKRSGASLRYLCVAERHKDGFPHYHMLLHEVAGHVSWEILSSEWPLGFEKWKLADKSKAHYVCKYLAKSSVARVRASLDYGNPPIVIGDLSPCPTRLPRGGAPDVGHTLRT